MRAAFAGVLIGLVVGGAGLAAEQPAPAPDLARAKDLYLAGEKAIADGRYTDAIRDYGATFDITHDPILFYKIASAYEKAGQCDVALIYFGRYVKEARPKDHYLEMTKERVRACGGDDRIIVSPAPAVTPPAPPAEPPPAPVSEPAPVAPAPAPPVAGAATPVAPGATSVKMSTRDRGAWLLVASSIGFVTIGAVLAYSANSAESDITDLYEGFTGTPAEFDDRTRATYDDLVAEGRRYEKLSWLSFGLAGATAIGAIVLFKTGDRERPVTVTPTASPTGAGVRATLHW
jgi:tetratricopeptide (TPR) repeat protein